MLCRAAQPTCGGLVQPVDFGLGRAACWGDMRKLAVLQSSTDWLQQPHAASGFWSYQGTSWTWCQMQSGLLQSSTGCHMLCPAQPTVQPGDFRLGRDIFDGAPGSLVLFRAAQDTHHLWWPGAACRFRAWQGILLGWHQAACSSAEQHRLAAAAWCSLRNSGLAGKSFGVASGTSAFCKAAQSGCNSLV